MSEADKLFQTCTANDKRDSNMKTMGKISFLVEAQCHITFLTLCINKHSTISVFTAISGIIKHWSMSCTIFKNSG